MANQYNPLSDENLARLDKLRPGLCDKIKRQREQAMKASARKAEKVVTKKSK